MTCPHCNAVLNGEKRCPVCGVRLEVINERKQLEKRSIAP